ncbi:hypothetical protein D3C73_1512010 [compost metagenome]
MYLANIQCGVQPVTMIGFSFLYAFSKAAAIAAPEPSTSFQSDKPYSSIASFVCFVRPAPGSIPMI